METLYAIRDAFFWWAGVWATVTMCNRAVGGFMEGRTERKGRNREEVQFEEHRQSRKRKERQREFMADIRQFHAEETTDNQAETAETAEPEAVAEETEAANAEDADES